MKIVSTPTPQPEHNHLAEIADNSLSSFDRIASAAQSKLRESNCLDATSLASVNTMTAQAAIATLSGINDDLRNDYLQLCKEPAIARLLLRGEDGREKVYYIARAGAPLPPGSAETVANIDLRSVVLRHCRSAATAKSQWARGCVFMRL